MYIKEEKNLAKVNRMVLILDYNPALKELYRILKELQVFVNLSPTLQNLLPVVPMLSFRRPKNLTDLLVRAKVRPFKEERKAMFGSGKIMCKVCQFVKTGEKVIGNGEKRSFTINHFFNCNSQRI